MFFCQQKTSTNPIYLQISAGLENKRCVKNVVPTNVVFLFCYAFSLQQLCHCVSVLYYDIFSASQALTMKNQKNIMEERI